MDTYLKERAIAIACRCDSRLCTLSVHSLIVVLDQVLPIAALCYLIRTKTTPETIHAQLVSDVADPEKYKLVRRRLAQLIMRRATFPLFVMGADEVAKVVIDYATRVTPEEFATYLNGASSTNRVFGFFDESITEAARSDD